MKVMYNNYNFIFYCFFKNKGYYIIFLNVKLVNCVKLVVVWLIKREIYFYLKRDILKNLMYKYKELCNLGKSCNE